jgi:hypothetical protein
MARRARAASTSAVSARSVRSALVVVARGRRARDPRRRAIDRAVVVVVVVVVVIVVAATVMTGLDDVDAPQCAARLTRMRCLDDDARDVDDVLDDIARAYRTTRARVVNALLARCGFERCATTTTTTTMMMTMMTMIRCRDAASRSTSIGTHDRLTRATTIADRAMDAS